MLDLPFFSVIISVVNALVWGFITAFFHLTYKKYRTRLSRLLFVSSLVLALSQITAVLIVLPEVFTLRSGLAVLVKNPIARLLPISVYFGLGLMLWHQYHYPEEVD